MSSTLCLLRILLQHRLLCDCYHLNTWNAQNLRGIASALTEDTTGQNR